MSRRLIPGLIVAILFCVNPTCVLAEYDNIPSGQYHDGGYSVCLAHGGRGYVVTGDACPRGDSFRDLWVFGTGHEGSFDLATMRTKRIGWSSFFGDQSDDCGYSIRRTSGGYVIAGQTASFGEGRWDAWLFKISTSGDAVWGRGKTFGGSADDHAYDVQTTRDGGYILVGATESYGKGGYDVFLVKTDPNGEEQWKCHYGSPEDEVGYSVRQTGDGGYIIAGYKESPGGVDKDVWLIKTDHAGKELWKEERIFGGEKDDCGRSVIQCSDGGYLIAGWTESYGPENRNAYIIKTDSDGKAIWKKCIGGKGYDCAQSIIESQNPIHGRVYVLTGWTSSYGTGSPATWLVAVDPNGKKVLWDGTYGGPAAYYGYCVEEIPGIAHGYVIAGVTDTRHMAGRNFDAFLFRVDSSGVLKWFNAYDSNRGLIEWWLESYIITGPFVVETAPANLVLSDCVEKVARRSGKIAHGSQKPRGASENRFATKDALRNYLWSVLSDQWIATHRVYRISGEPLEAVVLAEEPLQLRLAPQGKNRQARFPCPKKDIQRKEPLDSLQIADNIECMLKSSKNGFVHAWQHKVRDELVRELSERCFEYGAPLPGVSLMRLETNEQTGEMIKATVRIDKREAAFTMGDTVDGFKIVGMNNVTKTVRVRMGEGGEVFEIWPARTDEIFAAKTPDKRSPQDAGIGGKELNGKVSKDLSGDNNSSKLLDHDTELDAGTAKGSEASETHPSRPPTHSGSKALPEHGKSLDTSANEILQSIEPKPDFLETHRSRALSLLKNLKGTMAQKVLPKAKVILKHAKSQSQIALNPYTLIAISYMSGICILLFLAIRTEKPRRVNEIPMGQAMLVFSQNRANIERIHLVKDVISIGRDGANDIVLPGLAVSRRHCIIRGNGLVFTISDLDSLNGLRVNGQKLTSSRLHHGDVICINEYVMTFCCRTPFDEEMEVNSERDDG